MNPHLCPLTFIQDFMQFLIKNVNPGSSIWVFEEVVPVWGWTLLRHQNCHFQFLIISLKQWFRELAPSNGRSFLFILHRCSSSGLWCPSKLHLRTPSYFLSAPLFLLSCSRVGGGGMQQEMGAASASMRDLHRPVVVKKKLSGKESSWFIHHLSFNPSPLVTCCGEGPSKQDR